MFLESQVIPKTDVAYPRREGCRERIVLHVIR